MSRATLSLLLSLSLSLSEITAAATITFDELPFQSVDGLSFNGVAFDFRVDGVSSTEAHFASFAGSLDLTTISDPSLVGVSTGELQLEFDYPTSLLQFGAALSTADALNPGYTVELFDASSQSLGVFPVNTTAMGGELSFSEAMFSYNGAPAVRAIVDFADEPGSFALDNLIYEVPEPRAVGLFLCGVLAIGLIARIQ